MIDQLQDLRDLNLPFNIDDVTPQCHKCIREQLKKYENHVDSSGVAVRGKFIVPCDGIKKHTIDPATRAQLTDDQIEQIESVNDIVKFAKKFLKLPNGEFWEARDYQKDVLRCTSRRKVLRIARRAGKTDSVCVEICYHLFTTPNAKIIVVGPQKSQTEEIITRIRSFIKSNPILGNSVVRDVSAPWYEIELRNGSRLRGFAGGTKGKEGVAIRGQDADRIYIEEMDYVDQNALQGAIFPILFTTPNSALIGFSTPSGFRTPYYNLCVESPQYKEFHYTYKVLPWWKTVEGERDTFTEEQWTHEQLAEFGTSESGVYKPAYVDRAILEYDYKTIVRNPTWKYTIGTDWNEKYGTEIVVVGYNPYSTMFQVVDAHHIERSEFTQLAGITKLLEFNQKWCPHFIYIDAGNGSTNYELLRKTAYDNSVRGGNPITAKLLTILKKYDAGSSIEIHDPVTHQKRKSPAKSFMVNSSVRMFEQGKIKISSYDTKLGAQLRNYVIERYTPSGNPVYGQNDEKIGDHRLDAMNLAIVAFSLEFSDLHAQRIMTDVAIAPHPRSAMTDKNGNINNNRPPTRELAGHTIKNDFEKQLFPMGPGHANPELEGIITNRPGWSTDEEDVEIQKFLQKRRSRNGFKYNRPNRTKF